MADAGKKKDEESEQQAEQKPAAGGFNPMVLIGIVGGMIVLGLIAFVIVFKILIAPIEQKAAENAPAEKGTHQVEKKGKEGKEGKKEGKKEGHGEGGEGGSEEAENIFSFDEPLVVNLAETMGQRYLKTKIQLEVDGELAKEELSGLKPRMIDLMITILSSKTIDDVSNTVGRNRLRREIIDKCNAELTEGKVVNVYFTEFVIQ